MTGRRKSRSGISLRASQARSRTGESQAIQRSPTKGRGPDELAGPSKLGSFLKRPRLLSMAAGAVASVAAALFFRRSNQTTERPDDQAARESSSDKTNAPARPLSKPSAGERSAGAQSADLGTPFKPADELSSNGTARTRKKRSDAGVKRGPKRHKVGTLAPIGDNLVPALERTDASADSRAAGSDAPAEPQSSQSELEAEAHPS
jgi:hypothetical protein